MSSKKGGGGGSVTLSLVEQVLTKLAPNDAQHDFGNIKPTTAEEKRAYKRGLYKGSGDDINYRSEADSLSMIVSHVDGVVNPNYGALNDVNASQPYNANANYGPLSVANPTKDFCHTSVHRIVVGTSNKTYTVNYADVKYTKEAKALYKKILEAKDEVTITGATVAFNAKKKEINDGKNRKLNAATEATEATPEPESFINNLKEKIINSLGKSGGGKSSSNSEDAREEIDAPMFYKMMGLDPNQSIALVIDAASIGIIEILSRGTFPGGKRPIVYYIYGSEIVNDPAQKKHPNANEFKGADGVQWIPCVSINPPDFVYCYDYKDDPTGLYLNKFFTSFEFGLSELQETVNGRTIDYTTDLTIKAFDNRGAVKFIDESIDSKSKSDITCLTQIINLLKNALSNSDEKQFRYSISFLKKMAGDWLQVLLVLAIATRTRGFTPYISPTAVAGGGGSAAGGGRVIRENITAKVDRVFLLTHDQIALTNALVNGVECIFTHHTTVKGNPSLHSAFLYSLTSQAEVNASIISKATSLEQTNYTDQIRALTASKTEYDKTRIIAIYGPTNAIKQEIAIYLAQEIKDTFRVNWFDRYVKTLFTASLKIVAIKKILPDLATIDLAELTEKNNYLQRQFSTFKSAKDKATVEMAKELLELDASVNSQIQSCEKMIASAQHFFTTSNNGALKINDEIREFTKELIYVAAANWSWDSPDVNTRKLSYLTSVEQRLLFNADRNIFLNHLNSLDDDIKSQITLIFARCYKFIETNDTIDKFQNTDNKGKTSQLTSPQFQKFKPMAITFCYEVFINLGGKYNTTEITKTTIDIYCDKIITSHMLQLLNRDDTIEIEGKAINKTEYCANHISEEILLKQMNNDDLDTGIESFDNERVSEETLPPPPSTKTLPPPAKSKKSNFFMNFSSVFSACKLLKERVLSRTLRPDGRVFGLSHGGSKNKKLHMKGGAPPICNFHHQLPLYILLFQLHKTLSNENFEESIDYELTLQYYGFLLKMQEKFEELQENKDDAIKLGLGIRDFFFINNVVSKPLQITGLPILPRTMLSFSGLLTTGFCGALNEDYFTNNGDREASMQDRVFTEFINSAQIQDRFSSQLDLEGIVYKDFVKAVSDSAKEVANKIISDRASEESVSIEDDVVVDAGGNKEEGAKGDSNVIKYTPSGLTAAEMHMEPTIYSGPMHSGIHAFGGRKTRRPKKKITHRPKRQKDKKTRKRMR